MNRPLLLAGALLLAGCTDTHNFYFVVPDLGASSTADLSVASCTPKDTECVGTTSFRECHADHTWGTDIACAAGTTCDQGTCSTDPNTLSCSAGDGACVSGMAFTCRANGMGFDAKACPADTTCVGAGLCVGACGAVGSSFCSQSDPTIIVNCDGTTLTVAACPPPGADGRPNLCVTVGSNAACMPSDCNPATDCDVCGNPTISTIDPTTNASTCTETPGGFQWLTTSCAPAASCNPMGPSVGACGAGCAPGCTPGARRCNAGNVGFQTCGADGTWGAATSCNAGAGETCVTLNGVAGLCADPVCSLAAVTNAVTGACVLVSGKTQIRLCDATGHLGEPTDCASGLCHADAAVTIDGLQPGTCNVECNPGETRCDETEFSVIQSCTNGVWTTSSTCLADGGAGGQFCWNFSDVNGQRQGVCGLCAPGSHRCTNGAGVQGVDTTSIEVCAADGKSWGAPVVCTIGHCVDDGTDPPLCTADCVPGSKICMGNPVVSPSPLPLGTASVVTCTADGHVPNPPVCPSADPACCAHGTSCRLDQAGNSLGCVQCVGGSNEAGVTDTRCSNAAGTAEQNNGAAVQVCKADSSGWQAPQVCGKPTFTCHDADQATPAFCGSP